MLDRFNRPRPVAWFFFLSAMCTTLALGTWQVERLRWKQALITELADANSHAPITQLPRDAAELEKLQFRRATVTGTWMGDTEFHIAPRYVRDKFGYAILTPLKLNDGRILLVNRGWIPGRLKHPKARPETAVRGKTTLTGLIRTDTDRRYFTPQNQPDKNIWFARDFTAMAEHANLKNVIPLTLDRIDPNAHPVATDLKKPAVEETLPIPSDGTIRLRNDHLSYIITWYGIAAGILTIFLVYHRKK